MVKITEEVVNLECEPKGEIISESRSYMCIINGPQTGRNKITERKSLHYCARVNTHTLEQSLAKLVVPLQKHAENTIDNRGEQAGEIANEIHMQIT